MTTKRESPYREWKQPNRPSACTYHTEGEKSPHRHQPRYGKEKIMKTILENIGNTPMVVVNNIGKSEGLDCEILAKCEFFSSGGSIKDRIGLRMIQEAEAAGHLKQGDVLIEPTSGNTGIGIALVAAVKGYRCIIVMPEKMSLEKVDVLRALGAEIVRTPTTASFDSPESHIGVAKRLMEEIPNAHILDQYRNINNPLAHYDQTAEEILDACDDKLDMIVIGAGTGGTLTGISRKIRERCPNCKIIGVDPIGSVIAQPDSLNTTLEMYQVEGIGYDFIPTVCDRQYVDKWYKSNDIDAFKMSRKLIRREGFLCGGSSGSAMVCAIQAIKDFGLKKGDRCVVLMPDSLRNYMSKFLSDDWMIEHSFMEPNEDNHADQSWWWNLKVSNLDLHTPLTVRETVSIEESIELLNKEGFDQVPVVNESGIIMGMISVANMMTKIVSGRFKKTDPVSKITYTKFKKLSMDSTLGTLSRLLDIDHFTLIVHEQRQYDGKGNEIRKEMIFGVATRLDLLNFLTAKQPTSPTVTAAPTLPDTTTHLGAGDT